jgi:predicted flap endonuclease-1-like 5' DNA nuclease
MRDHMNPEAVRSNPPADDLQQITGIGPALALRLAKAGVTTYRDLAVLPPERIAELLADVNGLSAERIASQDWTGQATGGYRSAAAEAAVRGRRW